METRTEITGKRKHSQLDFFHVIYLSHFRYSELSPGEQQRLAWARMLFRCPRLAVLDEATSGVSEDLETLMYSEATSGGVTLVSVGHRGSLRQHHHLILVLGEDGSWSLGSVQAYNSQRNIFLNSPQ